MRFFFSHHVGQVFSCFFFPLFFPQSPVANFDCSYYVLPCALPPLFMGCTPLVPPLLSQRGIIYLFFFFLLLIRPDFFYLTNVLTCVFFLFLLCLELRPPQNICCSWLDFASPFVSLSTRFRSFALLQPSPSCFSFLFLGTSLIPRR